MSELSSKRVRYEKSPLIEVIFQLRFPTILKINAQQPVDFQDKIRESFPYYSEQLIQQGDVLINPQLQASTLRKLAENKSYEFVSVDHTIKINLAPSFISISTVNYTQWEEFRSVIESVIPAFEEVYNPVFYSRVGLRYIDAITRSNYSLEDNRWSELIQPHVLGMIMNENESGIKTYLSETEYETKEDDVISRTHFELVHVNDQEELSFLFDCDYFVLKMTQLSEMISIANRLHSASSNFIQTAITKKLHIAMCPVEL